MIRSARTLLLLGPVLVGSVAASGSQPLPVFRTGIDLVTVDAAVLDDEGRPVEGLGPEEFVLKIDGEERPIVSVEFVRRTPSKGSGPLEARQFSSNEHADTGRLVLLVVDQDHIRRVEGTAALAAAARFVDALDPLDRVGVTALTDRGPITFTRDRAALRARLETLVGRADRMTLQFNLGLSEALAIGDGSRTVLQQVVLRECGEPLSRLESPQRLEEARARDPCPVQIEQEARAVAQYVRAMTRASLDALVRLIERLADLEGPKTLVLLSEGLVVEPQLVDLANLAATAQAARVTIYVLQLDTPLFDAGQDLLSPTAALDRQLRSDGLALVAGAAGGSHFVLVGSDPTPFRRIARELGGYYLIAFEPTPAERDGRPHRIALSLRRPRRLTVRARATFRIDPLALTAGAAEQRLADLLRNGWLATELPLRAGTYTYAEPGTTNLRVVISVEALTGTGAAPEALVGYVLVDDRQVIAASGAVEAPRGRFAFSAVVPPGDYTLKVAALDRLGRAGSVSRPFSARLVRWGPLRVSDLMLARGTDDPRAALDPVIDVTRDRRLLAYLEVYGSVRSTSRLPTVHIEIAPGDDAPALATAAVTLTPRDGGWVIARAPVVLDLLPPGRYVARALIASGGERVGVVRRAFTLQ